MIFILMGVCGCGKTTVGEALAKKLGCEFGDADDFHSDANKIKMGKSIPLTDEDRIPWLKAIHAFIKRLCLDNKDGIVTCSALKNIYRNILVSGEVTQTTDEADKLPILFVYLKGSYEILHQRMAARTGHFMPTTLLESQLSTMEEPDNLESAITVNVDNSVSNIVEQIVRESGIGSLTGSDETAEH